MISTKLCVHCKVEPVRTPNDLLCKLCRAEKLLAGEDVSVRALDTLASGGLSQIAFATDGKTSVFARSVKCEACDNVEVYSHDKKKSSYFCDLCGKALCTACAAYCNHKDWNYTAKIVCKLCRADKSLTGQPVDEVEGSLPGQDGTEMPREPKPHCGRATCVGETMEPDWCRCECPKCKVAVSAGFFTPMFGKMTPDPDPVPPALAAPDQSDLDDEEEIARWEGGQP